MCFERLLQAFARWQPGISFDTGAQPILNTVELIVIHNCPCEHSSKLQLSIRFTPSHCLDVRQDWYPMYYPEGMKARVSPVQSIEPHRILAPTRDLNREPLGPQSRVVTTILPLHTGPYDPSLTLSAVWLEHEFHYQLSSDQFQVVNYHASGIVIKNRASLTVVSCQRRSMPVFRSVVNESRRGWVACSIRQICQDKVWNEMFKCSLVRSQKYSIKYWYKFCCMKKVI